MATYTTKSGDTWDKISLNLYGKETYVKELMNANQNQLETMVFSSGTILVVPEINIQAALDELPPWKSGG